MSLSDWRLLVSALFFAAGLSASFGCVCVCAHCRVAALLCSFTVLAVPAVVACGRSQDTGVLGSSSSSKYRALDFCVVGHVRSFC